jgi:CTD small phosphatase-like protein 2
MKDLTLIGRDLAKSVIIDNLEENFKYTTPDNGIHCSNFEGEMDDRELTTLGNFLERIAVAKVDDLRPYIKEFKAS